jgi:predicted ATP-dependent serine protease
MDLRTYTRRTLYECPECGLHYTSLQTAKQCDRWCKEHNSCNLEITNHAVELESSRHNPS